MDEIPKLSTWLLTRLQSNYNSSPVLGDLEEEFTLLCEEKGTKQARRWYRWQVLKSILPSFGHLFYLIIPCSTIILKSLLEILEYKKFIR